MSECGLEVGDRVSHVREPDLLGTVVAVDHGYELGGVTTCRVHWDDLEEGDTDIQWTNKLFLVEEHESNEAEVNEEPDAMSVDTNRPSTFELVRTKVDLDTLDEAEIVAGYTEYTLGDPEPGPNRGRAYWHGWRNAAADHGQIPIDDAMRSLAAEVCPGTWRKLRVN